MLQRHHGGVERMSSLYTLQSCQVRKPQRRPVGSAAESRLYRQFNSPLPPARARARAPTTAVLLSWGMLSAALFKNGEYKVHGSSVWHWRLVCIGLQVLDTMKLSFFIWLLDIRHSTLVQSGLQERVLELEGFGAVNSGLDTLRFFTFGARKRTS